jgi:hypothetical protein
MIHLRVISSFVVEITPEKIQMFIIRWLSLVLIVIAVMLLGADLVSTLEKRALAFRSLDQILMLFVANAKLAVQSNFPPQIANVCTMLMGWPGWALFGVLGVISALVASAPRKPSRPPPSPPPIAR